MKSRAKYIRVSPRKARLVADMVRGLSASRALDILKFTPNKAASVISAVVYSALSNAVENHSANPDTLHVKQILVDEGPTWKRTLPRSQGRANRLNKRTSHITVVLAEG